MNDDSSIRSSRVMLTAGIVICSLLAVISFLNLPPGKMPRVLSVGTKSNAVIEANRQLSQSYAEFYPGSAAGTALPVRTISHTADTDIRPHASSSGKPPIVSKSRDVFQRDQIVDTVDVAQEDFRKSLRQLSTTTVVEKSGSSMTSGVIDSPASTSSDTVEKTSSAASTLTPHITVPVTVNVDNGEILSELMKIQEQVLVTRSQLDIATSTTQTRSVEASESVSGTRAYTTPPVESVTESRTHETHEDNGLIVEPSPIQDSDSLGAESSQSVVAAVPEVKAIESTIGAAMPESSEVPKTEFSAFEPETASESPPTADVPSIAFDTTESLTSPAPQAAVQDPAESEVPELNDFAEPHFGPSEQEMEESLPEFELPSQSSKKHHNTTMNSYAEWIQSFEDSDSSAEVAPASFQAGDDALPELPSFEFGSSQNQPDSFDPSTVRESAEPLAQVPNIETAEPMTAVPPVPTRAETDFHEAASIPVFPVSRTAAPSVSPATEPGPTLDVPVTGRDRAEEPLRSGDPARTGMTKAAAVASPPSSPSEEVAPQHQHSESSRRTAVAQRSDKRVANGGQKAAAQRRSVAASTGKPQAATRSQGPGKPQGTGTTIAHKSRGLLTKVKSTVSSAVAKVPKPDLDTPMWVDRLADWKDERFGKKNETSPQMGTHKQSVASVQRPADENRSSPQQQVAKSSRPMDRRNDPRTTQGTRSASTSGKLAGSNIRPRPNVTTVPRSGVAQSQTQTALAKTTQAQPTQVQPTQAQPTQAQPTQAQPTQVQTAQVQRSHTQTAEAEIAQVQTSQIPTNQIQTAEPAIARAETASLQNAQMKPPEPLIQAVAADGPSTPVPPRPQWTPPSQPEEPQPSQPKLQQTAQTTAPAATNSGVANASYRHDSSNSDRKPVTKTSHSRKSQPQAVVQQAVSSQEFSLQPGASPQMVVESQPSGVTHTYQPMPHPKNAQTTPRRQVASASSSSSHRFYGKQSAVQPAVKPSRPAVISQPTEYVSTIDAFNMRMTMVVRPPSMAGFGMRPMSQWFSGPQSMEPAEPSPTLHRVSSTMRYATQPKSIR